MIVHLITNLAANKGGTQGLLARLLLHASGQKCAVISLTEISDQYRELFHNAGIECKALNVRSPQTYPSALLRLSRQINHYDPDILMCWMYHSMAVGVLARSLAKGKPRIIWNVRQSLDDTKSMSRSTVMAIRVCRTLSSQTDGIIYNSIRARKLHEAYGYDTRFTDVIPNGFEIPDLTPPNNAPPRVFGVAGRFHPQKDHHSFFKAFSVALKARPELKAILAGDGLVPSNRDVRRLMELNAIPADSVKLRGEISDMQSFYNSIDTLVLSSRTESFPNVVAEAMSYGRPVITTDVGDAAMIVNDMTCVVEPGQPEALAEKIVRFADMEHTEFRKLAEAARTRIIDTYSMGRMYSRYQKVIDQFTPRIVTGNVDTVSYVK